MTNSRQPNQKPSDLDLKSKKKKDYGKYFNFTAPNLTEAKKRSRTAVQVVDFPEIPEDLKKLGKEKYFYLRTYGCQANEHDSETIIGLFQEMGYTATDDEKEADVILFNTCAIRENAEDKVFG